MRGGRKFFYKIQSMDAIVYNLLLLTKKTIIILGKVKFY